MIEEKPKKLKVTRKPRLPTPNSRDQRILRAIYKKKKEDDK